MTIQTELRGVTPPLVTPFSADGREIDEDGLKAVIDHASDGGVAGLFPCGTTGEFASLDADERCRVIEIAVENADGRPVLAGVADTAVADVLEHADRAAEAGADAVVVTPPYYHAGTDAGVERFLREIAHDAPRPVLLYDIPSCTGSPLPPKTTLSLSEHDNVVGIKDSSGNLGRFATLCREAPPEFLLLQGFDSLVFPSLRLGADGGINALANVVPDLLAELVSTAEDRTDGRRDGEGIGESDEQRARTLHEAIGPLFEACLETGFASSTKAALRSRGVIEEAAVRPPNGTLSPDERDRIERLLAETTVFENE